MHCFFFINQPYKKRLSIMKEHKISLFTAVLLTMNIMIGSGILIGPGNIAAIAGSASFLAWP